MVKAMSEDSLLVGDSQPPRLIGTCFGCLQPVYSDQEWRELVSPNLARDGSHSLHVFHDLDVCLPRSYREGEGALHRPGGLFQRLEAARDQTNQSDDSLTADES
jgi:hypothetical protein